LFLANEPVGEATVDPRVEPAIEEALAELEPESRFVLVAHFLDGCTLARIGAILGMHESTVSRRVAKLTKALRRSVLRNLRTRGMSTRAAEEALDIDVRRLSVDVRRQLLQSVEPIRGGGPC
jgi:RNA polymerase sigma-70 factor, ECF subfamily